MKKILKSNSDFYDINGIKAVGLNCSLTAFFHKKTHNGKQFIWQIVIFFITLHIFINQYKKHETHRFPTRDTCRNSRYPA